MTCEEYINQQRKLWHEMLDAGLVVEHPDEFNQRMIEETADSD